MISGGDGQRPLLPPIPLAILLVSSFLFWCGYATERIVSAQLAHMHTLHSPKRPLVLNGLLFRLDRHLSRPPHGAGQSRALVLISSDACRYSWDELPRWRRLIAELHFDKDDTLLLISLSGRAIQQHLEEAARLRQVVPLSSLVTDQVGFIQETGVSWTPHTLVLRDSIVRTSSERVTPTVHVLIKESFSR